MSKIKQIAEELALPVAEEMGLDLYDVEYKKDGTDWRLTYFIDKDGGVTLNDCEEFSNRISDVLDQADPIEQNYILTVSSPGIERKLAKTVHYAAVVGQEIEVKLFAAYEGNKKYNGILKSYSDDGIVLEADGKEISLAFKDISTAKTVYHF